MNIVRIGKGMLNALYFGSKREDTGKCMETIKEGMLQKGYK